MIDSSADSLVSRLLRPIAQVRAGEATTALLMFSYSFLAMTGYNVLKPVTRGLFISNLGADNLPWVQFGAGVLIGLIMQAYSRVIALVPRRWMIPVTMLGMVTLLVLFWAAFSGAGDARIIAAAFYLYGLILGILLISQFWTLANDVYDARQAKRLFGLIGAGASLGGAAGAALTATFVERYGANAMLLVSASILTLCFGIVTLVIRREQRAGVSDASKTGEQERVSTAEAFQLLRSSKHLQLISFVIAFAAIGAAIIEQQLNMATAEAKGATNTDAISAFLAVITVWLSMIGFVIQVGFTSRIHRNLGIGFALLILPVSLGGTGLLMLTVGALWTSGLARILDTSLRYTVDKTSREILFLPLPVDLKYRAKPFIDVTVDRVAKGLSALLILVLIKDWGLGLTWQQLSIASLCITVLWIWFAMRARRQYMAAFRQSIEQQDVKPGEIRLNTADLNTIEALIGELAHPEPRRVVYAIDLLESLDKRHLVTPLLLHHESPQVRARALKVAGAAGAATAHHWVRGIERSLKDSDSEVRLAAVRALAALHREDATDLMRGFLTDSDPVMVVTAACGLAESALPDDRIAAEHALRELASDTREQAVPIRFEVAHSLGYVRNPKFRSLLVPLMFDADLGVAREAIRSAGRLGPPDADFLFLPPLVSLMRNRLLKAAARQVLVEYGDDVVDPLAYFLRDTDEDVWVRRHVPSTLALIPSQKSLDVLVEALSDSDGFVRFKAVAAIERVRRAAPGLTINRAVIERQILQETTRAFGALTLHHNLFVRHGLDRTALLAQALTEKQQRAVDRMFRLLGMLYSPEDVNAVRIALTSADSRLRSGAIEYLDNLLQTALRRRVMIVVEEMPSEERIRRGNVLFKTRVRDVEDTVAQLVHDDDQVIAAAAIQLVEQRQMWTLADDLEHALAHRDPRDWYVFEAASWALAARRMPAERRRALWLEPLPAVELANRLRTVPLFAFASVDELFRVAMLGRQVRHEPGRVMYEAGRPVDSIQFILDGRVAGTRPGEEPKEIAAPSVVGFEAVIEGSPAQKTMKAVELTIALSLTTEEFLSLLSENVEIAQGIFRLMVERRGGIGWRTVVHGSIPPSLEAKMEAGALQPLDTILLLQSSPLLSRATATQLVGLSAIARAVVLTPGSDPLAGADAAVLVLLSGAMRIERNGAPVETARPGDIIGIYETLGGVSFPVKSEVVEAGHGLRFMRADVLDVLADDIGLLRGIFSALLHVPEGPGTPHLHEPQDSGHPQSAQNRQNTTLNG
ncbi:MAG TPA: Npt1/Npt2 family nucleotide transporter [Vicinamibacterales bacterium]|nr:Npt1/Npt2 family nucleotide transporter [Vicinamibacterales bacterium]